TPHQSDSNDSDSDSELFETLETDADLSSYREKRIEQLKLEVAKAKEERETHFGTCEEIYDEKEIFKITTSHPRCVLHLFHKDFRRCAIMDMHLQLLAKKYPKTKFMKMNVEKATFLVHHLKVKILPCVIFFIDGITKERLIGFEELGNTDDFPTILLEKRLHQAKVIASMSTVQDNSPKSILQGSLSKKEAFLDGEEDDDEV
ncbi:hypothetical protein HMI54_006258, partial [Coelomomyces lativittatus]